MDAGLSVTLVEDAVGAGATEGVVKAARTLLRPLLQMKTSSNLPISHLEVVS